MLIKGPNNGAELLLFGIQALSHAFSSFTAQGSFVPNRDKSRLGPTATLYLY